MRPKSKMIAPKAQAASPMPMTPSITAEFTLAMSRLIEMGLFGEMACMSIPLGLPLVVLWHELLPPLSAPLTLKVS